MTPTGYFRWPAFITVMAKSTFRGFATTKDGRFAAMTDGCKPPSAEGGSTPKRPIPGGCLQSPNFARQPEAAHTDASREHRQRALG